MNEGSENQNHSNRYGYGERGLLSEGSENISEFPTCLDPNNPYGLSVFLTKLNLKSYQNILEFIYPTKQQCM